MTAAWVEMIWGLNPLAHALPCASTWVEVNEEVDAIVQYRKDFSTPLLKAINWQGKRRSFVGTPVVEADHDSIHFGIRDKSTRYPSGDNFGTFPWPSREEIESLLVGPQ